MTRYLTSQIRVRCFRCVVLQISGFKMCSGADQRCLRLMACQITYLVTSFVSASDDIVAPVLPDKILPDKMPDIWDRRLIRKIGYEHNLCSRTPTECFHAPNRGYQSRKFLRISESSRTWSLYVQIARVGSSTRLTAGPQVL